MTTRSPFCSWESQVSSRGFVSSTTRLRHTCLCYGTITRLRRRAGLADREEISETHRHVKHLHAGRQRLERVKRDVLAFRAGATNALKRFSRLRRGKPCSTCKTSQQGCLSPTAATVPWLLGSCCALQGVQKAHRHERLTGLKEAHRRQLLAEPPSRSPCGAAACCSARQHRQAGEFPEFVLNF